jgi:hypothetical protein
MIGQKDRQASLLSVYRRRKISVVVLPAVATMLAQRDPAQIEPGWWDLACVVGEG